MMIALIVFSFFLTIIILGQLIYRLTFKQRRIEQRLKLILDESILHHQIEEKPNPLKGMGRWKEALSFPGSIISRKHLGKLQTYLVKAGVPLKPEEIITLSIIFGVSAIGIGLLLFRHVSLGLLLGLFGFLAPAIWVYYLKQRRLKLLESQLLNSIILMSNSLRAGHSFLQALELVSREAPLPLSEEFNQVIRETKIGISLEEALTNLSMRVGSKDLELVITGVLIQRQLGGNLAEVLDNIAETIEKRIKLRTKIRVLTAQGRLTAWIISLLPFGLAFMVFYMYPDFGRIMLVEPLGLAMLVAGGIMLAIGILIIRKVVNVNV